MMSRSLSVFLLLAFALVFFSAAESAADRRSSDILRQGLLGAGSGAVGGAASGARGGDLWKGALAGAGVNIVGGALLDSISGEKVADTREVDRMSPQRAYSDGYQEGYENAYRAGYAAGYREGLLESRHEM